LLDRVLTVLRGVADIILARPANGREARTQGVDHSAGVVHRQGRLGYKGQFFGVFDLQVGDVLFIFDQVDRAAIAGVVLAHSAFDFRVAGMANQDALTAVTAVARHFDMHLGDQRAGRIEHFKAAPRSLCPHSLGNAMGTEDDDDVVRHLIQFFDKDCATGAQVFNDKFVVHHFVANIDRRTEYFQSAIDDFNRTVHPGAEATGVGEFDMHAGPRGTRRKIMPIRPGHSRALNYSA